MDHKHSRGSRRSARFWALGIAALLLAWSCAGAVPFKEAEQRFLAGDYARCVALAEKVPLTALDAEDWQLLRCKALLATGQYAAARQGITNALEKEQTNIRLCWAARQAYLANGQTNAAAEALDDIIRWVQRHPRDYNDAPSLVVFGQAVLLKGADPKRVLNMLYASAKKSAGSLREACLAGGALGLEKHDYALAAKEFEAGLKETPDDPDLLCGLARAYAPSDLAVMASSLEKALQRNPRHTPSLLLLADRCIDAEDYAEAERFLGRVEAVNPWQPEAWAYRAVLAHLRNQPAAEEAARQKALTFWPSNPTVDYLIGLKLSQNYRFAEGAAHQRQARRFDPDFLPAQAQLAQDLLRLGEETEGWALAEAVQKKDGYDVEAFNLTTLHDTLAKYATLTNGDFLVRLSRREAPVYGDQVLALLSQARSNLCAKFGFEVKRPTLVEVFSEQKDFAVRTFGMPGNPGYLGVCFGGVVTANGPAARLGHPVNWQAVLWHEFCHVVTLQLTHNKMPRWLSEGISVFEESQANPTWGQRLNPRYREMLLGDDLVPVAKLSSAFLSPRSALHLQFAYFESALAVRFIVERFGFDQLKAILRDLGNGVDINDAIRQHTAPWPEFETNFVHFARQQARDFAPGLDWTKPAPAAGAAARLAEILGGAPSDAAAATSLSETNFYRLLEQASRLLRERQFQQAKAPLEKLTRLYPGQTGADSAPALLAEVYRELGETNAERQVLARWAEADDEAVPAYLRLMELGAAAADWPAVELNARRYLAVDPLVAAPYRFLALAGEHTGQLQAAVQAYRTWLLLDPLDPADVHYRLADLLHRLGDPEARRQALEALEDAPRHRAALRLLLDLQPDRAAGQKGGT